MASINISESSYTTSSITITVNYTVDITLTNIQISKDGVNFINAISFSQTTATFNVSTWENGTYDNCFLRGYYTDSNEDNLVYFGDNNDIPTDEDLIYFEDGNSVYFEDE